MELMQVVLEKWYVTNGGMVWPFITSVPDCYKCCIYHLILKNFFLPKMCSILHTKV